ncbi:MAG: hypothetical protein ACKO2K_19105, partial [Alphaproteobacteria bacterium]
MDERVMDRSGQEPVAGGVEPSPWRRCFPIADRSIFLDHAGVAPISVPVREAIERFAAEAMLDLPLRYPHWEEQAEETRRSCAELVRADAHQLAFVKNTSE